MSARLISVEEALALILAEAQPLGSETLRISEAHGRFLTATLTAPFDLPAFDNSAMDGFAVNAADTPGTLQIIGESAAGLPFMGQLAAGQAVGISTGAVMPDGADAVAIVEQVTVENGQVTVPGAVEPGKHVRLTGGDVRRGDPVISAGCQLGAAQIGAAAALGSESLTVGRRPSVAVVPTGTELRALGTQLPRGGIYDSNGPMLQALVSQAGGIPTALPAPDDDADAVRLVLGDALGHDVVITTGGVSMGPHDIVREIESELGVAELFWGVKLRPGKPLSFGVHGRKLIFGIPGNPVSALVCFELFVRPALEALQGAGAERRPFQTRLLASEVRPNSERDEMVRVILTASGSVEPLSGQMSHQLTVSAQADGLARIPIGDTVLAAGTPVSYLPLRD